MNAITRAMRYPLQEEEAGGDKGGAGGGGAGEKKGGAGDEGLGSTEDRARRMGWVPKEEFKGAHDRWTDAETFVRNGEESLPILRERLRSMERANVDLSRSLGEFRKLSDDNFAKGYSKAKRELEAEIKAKAKAGDDAGAAAAAGELADLEGEKVRRQAKADDDPVFEGWVGQNQWFNDPALKSEAEVEAFRLRHVEKVTVEGAAFLDLVKEAMKKRFPEKFGNPRRNAGGGSVERPSGGGEGGGGGGAKKGWEHMPAEAKEAGDRYIKQKLFKDKAAYAAQYWEQN